MFSAFISFESLLDSIPIFSLLFVSLISSGVAFNKSISGYISFLYAAFKINGTTNEVVIIRIIKNIWILGLINPASIPFWAELYIL